MTPRTDQVRNERKKGKRDARRAEHIDKYADAVMQAKIAALVAHFNGEEADHA